jgi:K(+)-stimulated pyrophosphate-energized sodium pump
MLFVGGMIPVVFWLCHEFCGKAAMDMVYEVRRQFKKFQELWKELENQNMLNVFLPNSLREMMLPGILTIGFIAIVLLGKLVYADNN